jgi:hypothetical protein
LRPWLPGNQQISRAAALQIYDGTAPALDPVLELEAADLCLERDLAAAKARRNP